MNQNTSRAPAFFQNGRDWLHSNAHTLLTPGVGTYNVRMLRNCKFMSPTLGVAIAPPNVIGTLVKLSATFAVMQDSADHFTVLDSALLGPIPPALHTRIQITPYHARDFDGVSLYQLPASENPENARLIGKRRCMPPVQAQSEFVQILLEQITDLPAPDGVRTITEALVDAGARREGVFITEDPTKLLYSVTFKVASSIFEGTVAIGYEVSSDLYWVELAKQGEEAKHIDDVYFDCLGDIICEAIDDGLWQQAQITVLEERPTSGLPS